MINYKATFLNVASVVLVAFSAVSSQAFDNCSGSLISKSLQEILKTPFLQRMEGRAITRMLTERFKISMDKSIGRRELSGGLGFTSPMEVWGQFQQVGDTLQINIVQVYLKSRGETLNIGQQPDSLNLQFVSLLRAGLDAAQYWADSHPGLKKVVFEANEIQNPRLKTLLLSLGFSGVFDENASLRISVPL